MATNPNPNAEYVPTKVWVLTISHKHGIDTEVYDTEEAARDGLLDYVKQWWDEYDHDDEMPADRDQAISRYFDDRDDEWVDLVECVVRTQNDRSEDK